MAVANTKAGERYTIRQKIFKVFGDSFEVFGEDGRLVGFCKQKFLRLREDIRLYTDRSCSTDLLAMKARSIMDFSTVYDVLPPGGGSLGSLRRKGLRSMVRDEWAIFDVDGVQTGTIAEDSMGLALMRRLIPLADAFSPQRFHVADDAGRTVAIFRTHFNPFVYRLGITVLEEDDRFDDLLILAAAVLIAAIEGRQSDGGSGTGMFSGD